MCGIVGIFDMRAKREINRRLLSEMNESQYHRGPDEGGLHAEPGVGLGHRRLSIIDLSSGQQPLFNEDGSVVIVYNGEIYNFPELMEALTRLGHRFRTRCDTEVIVHAWEEWGESCVDRFRGMFAFALWDRNRSTFFVGRDRLGVKPLFYTQTPDGMFVFASELKGLLCYPGLKREIDPCGVEEYFAFGYVPEPRTIYKDVYKLAPGRTLTLRSGSLVVQPRKYWDVPFQSVGPISVQDAQHELVDRLREAVRIRLVAEVPLGAFLSGGVDSSAVVAAMAKETNEPVNTCSIAFGDPSFDESKYAAQVAALYQTRHHVQTVENDDYDLIDMLARLYDEPYADSSAIPTYRVCELARKRVVVALSGDGGDENLAGYRRYRFTLAEQRLRDKLPESVRRPVFGALGRYYPKADWAPRIFRAKTTFESLSRDLVDGYFHNVSLMSDGMRERLFNDGFRRQLQGYRANEVMRGHAANAPTDDPLSLIQYLDIKTYLPGDILTKVDRASMAHALEVRVPLLDHKLVEWISGLPSSYKLHGGQGKYLFKKALEPHLPRDILYRDKMGFSTPLARWFRGPLRQRVRCAILGPTLASAGIFNQGYLEEMIDHHESGRRDYSASIWSLLMFEAFLRNVHQGSVGSERPALRVA